MSAAVVAEIQALGGDLQAAKAKISSVIDRIAEGELPTSEGISLLQTKESDRARECICCYETS
jgi:hypothetical protein